MFKKKNTWKTYQNSIKFRYREISISIKTFWTLKKQSLFSRLTYRTQY